MTPSDLVKALAKPVVSGAIDLASDGALVDLQDLLLPDINARLSAEFDSAREDMWLAVLAVARTIVARALGTDPSAKEVGDFFNRAAADPAFAARTMRLISEGLRSPSEHRRRLLARALFTPHGDPDLRDRIDLAVERLAPPDVELLRQLASGETAHGHKLLRRQGVDGGLWSLARDVRLDAIPGNLRVDDPVAKERTISCHVMSLYALSGALCIELMEPTGLADASDQGLCVRHIHVLPVGRGLIDILSDERLADAREREGVPA